MKTCFSLLLGMVLVGCLAVTPAGATLVLHYDFQTLGSSAPEVTDLTGGNDGTLGSYGTGSVTHVTDGSGPGGSNYLRFAGDSTNGGWVQADNTNGALDLTGSFTIATRFKGHAASAAETMLSRYDDGANPGFRLHMTADEKVEAYFVTSTTTFEYVIITSSSAYASDWHLAVLKYDGTAKSLSLYVDYDGKGGGEKIVVAQTNLGNPVPAIAAYSPAFRVGAQDAVAAGATPAAYRGFNDGLDDVRVHDTALSDADVADLIPEPTTMGLLVIGGLLAIRRRR